MPVGETLQWAAPPHSIVAYERGGEAWQQHEALRGDKLAPMVLYGNSFAGPYLHSGLYFQFAEVHNVINNNIPVEAALRKLPPNTRYMILQFSEPFLGEFLQYQIPEE